MSARDFANTFKASFAIIIFWMGGGVVLVRFDNENTHVQIIRLQSPHFTSENVCVCVYAASIREIYVHSIDFITF